MPELLLNPWKVVGLEVPPPSPRPRELHRKLPGYAPTPLRSFGGAAARLGVGAVLVKDESSRLGLPAYKVLGASWATVRALESRRGRPLGPWDTLGDLRQQLGDLDTLTLVTASDGNHGRGVARVARWLGLGAEIYLPLGTAPSRLRAIAEEGARVVEVPGTYDATVARAAEAAGPRALLIQDHGWPGYEEIPGWVAEGYETLLLEVDEQVAALGPRTVSHVLIPVGVGTLAAAVVAHYRRAGLTLRPRLLSVEPTGAACALRSIEAGEPVLLEVGADASIMAGLNCGTPSSQAWPLLRGGLDACLAVDDAQAAAAMRTLATEGMVVGESGAASWAGLEELLAGAGAARAREALGLDADATILLFCTEGATDPGNWERIVGRPLPR